MDKAKDQSDESLVERTLNGSHDAFSALVRRHKQRVIMLVARFSRDKDDLDDISQDVFIKAYENLRSFRGESPFEHWLVRIAVRTCYDLLRKRKHERMNVPLERAHLDVADTIARPDGPKAQAADLIQWGLSRLKADERLVITLLELEEKSVKEVADWTGWSEANVKVRAFRARQKLKKLLEANNGK